VIFGPHRPDFFGTLLSSMSFCGVGTVMLYGSYNGEKSANEVFNTKQLEPKSAIF